MSPAVPLADGKPEDDDLGLCLALFFGGLVAAEGACAKAVVSRP